MIGSTISHYASKTHPRSVAGALERKRPLADKILEKLDEAHLRSSNFGGQAGLTTFLLAGLARRNFLMICKVSL